MTEYSIDSKCLFHVSIERILLLMEENGILLRENKSLNIFRQTLLTDYHSLRREFYYNPRKLNSLRRKLHYQQQISKSYQPDVQRINPPNHLQLH